MKGFGSLANRALEKKNIPAKAYCSNYPSIDSKSLIDIRTHSKSSPDVKAEIIWVGSNDIDYGENADTIVKNIKNLTMESQRKGRKVCVVAVPFRQTRGSWDPRVYDNEKIYGINHEISEFTKEAGMKFIYPPRSWGSYTYGGSHFNMSGKRIVANKIGRWLEEVFPSVAPVEEKDFL